MLIVPLIKIKSGLSVTKIRSDFAVNVMTDDPVKLSIIFRGENFKSIYFSLLDTDKEIKCSINVLERIIKSVDIPITVTSCLKKPDEIENLFKLGCYRVNVNFNEYRDFDLIKILIKEFSGNRICVKLNSINGDLYDCKWDNMIGFSDIVCALRLKEIGVKRLVYSNFFDITEKAYPNFGKIQSFLEQTNFKITLLGGIHNLTDLNTVHSMEKYGIDSLVIGRALYENKFCCEMLWRQNEKFLADLGPTRRI